jgi:signal transduction histidine kinase/CheY-like chemotaxis protein
MQKTNYKARLGKFLLGKNFLLLIVVIIASAGLVGWETGERIFTTVFVPDLPIAPSTATLLILISLNVFFLINFGQTKWIKLVTRLNSFSIIFFCGLIFLQFILGFSWNIEKIFITNPVNFDPVHEGKMSPITALFFISVSLNLMLFYNSKNARVNLVNSILSHLVLVATFIFITGYIYRTPLLYGGNIFIPVAFPTAICFFLLSFIGIRLHGMPFGLSVRNTIQYQLSTSFIPLVIIIIILHGFLVTIISSRFHNPAIYSAILLFAAVVVSILIINKNSALIGAKISKAEQLLQEKSEALARQNEEFKQLNVELHRAKEQAQESERLKSAFLANMSHEIRTPMNGILGFAELLKEPDLTGEDQLEYVSIIEKSGLRMLNIINDIIDISKIESGLMKITNVESDINDQIEYVLTFFKPEIEAKGMSCSFEPGLSSNRAVIITDKEKIFAILTNLVKNAIKYSDKGSISVGYLPKGQFLEFYVKDTGIGIPANRIDAIFERFIQADISDKRALHGAGLGLSITKAYVELLGGKIRVDSTVGIGSIFYFTIPYIVDIQNKMSNGDFLQEAGTNSAIPGLKILIAEDDETSQRLMVHAVNSIGKEIIRVRTGAMAVEACRNNPDIDLVLLDIQMPEVNGYEAATLIRQFNEQVFIIAQTAYGLAGDREKALEAGCNAYFSKPVNIKELQSFIITQFSL